ncbi:sigma-54-dependent Fis family transcriptional regulator [Bacteroidetes/Chlorobi group bacterium ChocPot_Mid]|jgi:DNA-binding NtrC family response regulator|nr:MAG: sigma-54-dependent Fis family transcriptional regulator [Bacteroidetes/Chlorobi group bacterium ChocPot_Mid]
MALQNYTIVVIEDDQLVNSTLKNILESKFTNVFTYLDGVQAQDELNLISADLVLLDIFLGHTNGLEILENLRKQGYTMPVIMMTAFSDLKMAVRAMKLGAEDFIVKPLDLEQLEVTIEKALHNYDLRRQVNLLSERLAEEKPSEILGDSPEIQKAKEIAKIVASAPDTTALILGETGTGKELFAKYIHENSDRKRGPFVTINCGAIPKELAENELFGYERGAFTGATEKIKQGRFEQANHGTILLDEVAELSLDLQVKLLRVLQEKKYYRLGGEKEISVDVRIITSTNKDLEQLVEEGKFREDLFYRLNVAKIELPPLRDRGQDIFFIATALINEFNKKFSKNVTGFTQEAKEILMNYHWKGNIRELRNVIERVVLLETDTVVTKEALSFLKPPATTEVTSESKGIHLKDGEHYLKIANSGVSLANVTKDLIIQTLKLTNGNQIKAAKLLEVSRAKLRYRIEQLGINITGKDIS